MGKFKFWLLILFIIFTTQFYYPVNGFFDDQLGLVITEMAIQKKMSPLTGFDEMMVKDEKIQPDGLSPATGYGFFLVDPLFTFVSTTYSSIVGISIPKWHFLSVLIFVGLLYFAYKLSELFFGKEYGFIFPILMATNVFINVTVRNSIILHPLVLLSQFGTIYFFIKLHQKKERKIFLLAALFLFFSLANGTTYSLVILIHLVMILVALILGKVAAGKGLVENPDFKCLRLREYLFLFMLVPLISSVMYFFNDLYLNLPLGTSLDAMLNYTKSRLMPDFEHPDLTSKLEGSFDKLKTVFFGTRAWEIGGPHITMFSYRTPILGLASIFLFFPGLFYLLKNINYKNLILLFFLLYTFFYIYGVGAPRIFISFVPFLLLISALGFKFILEAIKLYNFNRLGRILVIALLILGLGYDVYFFNRFFVVKSSSNLVYGSGINEVKKYLNSIEGNKAIIAMSNSYQSFYLNDINQTPYFVFASQDKDAFKKLIEELLGKYDEAIFIFPSGFYYIGNPGYLVGAWEFRNFENKYSFFREVVPELVKPDKVIYNYQKIPQHYLYRLSKNKNYPKRQRLIFEPPYDESFPIEFDGKIETIKIQGGVEKIMIQDDSKDIEIPINASRSTQVLLNFEDKSLYDFNINFADDSFKENLYERTNGIPVKENLKVTSDGSSLAWIEPNFKEGRAPYLLEYLFDFPYKIERVDVKADMRMFNASIEKDEIRQYLVTDEKHFDGYWLTKKFQTFRVKSDGSDSYSPGGEEILHSGTRWGLGQLSSYQILYPNSKKSLIAFQFFSSIGYPNIMKTHLWTLGDSSFFKFTLDTQNLKKPEVRKGDKIRIERGQEVGSDEEVIIDIFYYPK